jgi:glycosyltransferase involved in cell wall biosynthesis
MIASPEVAIVYRFLPEWRLKFFCKLREELATRSIRLRLIYGKCTPRQERQKSAHRLKWGAEVDVNWGIPVRNRFWNVGNYELVWQHLPHHLRPELLILMQESSIISNYPAALRQVLRGKKVALWGHGTNRNEGAHSLANRFKSLYSGRADWWFAYTSGVAEQLRKAGFPADRITVVENAIDTEELFAATQNVTPCEIDRLRRDTGLSEGPIGLFCGAMYPGKKIGFLTQACDRIRELVPNFQMILLGSGGDAPLAQEFAERRPWAHYLGPKYGTGRAPYFLMSDLFLMPGSVGLAVLDCFATGTPLITTASGAHGPEIEYLDDGIDGIISPPSLDGYVSAVLSALQSEHLQRLKSACRAKATRYTVENMAHRFAQGIEEALTT